MSEIKIRYFGISAFEITSEKGVKVLIDPCITGLRGIKFSPVGLEAFPRLDIILVSHAAEDHLGDTLEIARQTGCDVMAAKDVATYLRKKGINPAKILSAIWGTLHDYKGLRIKVLESHHGSWLEDEGGVLSHIPLGFILYTESGLGIYHPGDTSIFGDLKLFGELYHPQIGLLPVGLPIAGNGRYELSPEEAAIVTKWMGLKIVIPMHYPRGSSEPQDFALNVHRESPDTKVVVMEPGEEIIYKIL
jgi:L-ascorbate metabolism protein UlaG (beta-lactamase superfamily)